MEIIVNSVFSTAVIAAVVTAIFTYINTKKRNELEHITAERKEWRQDLRGIAEQINSSKTANDLCDNLVPLKVRINLTKRKEYQDSESNSEKQNVLDPSDIDKKLWKEISEIENKVDENTDFDFNKTKREIIRLIEGLLKYDWERSKSEVKGNRLEKISNIVSGIGMMFFLIGALGGTIRFVELLESANFLNILISMSNMLFSDFTVFLSVLALLCLAISIVKDSCFEHKKQEKMLCSEDKDTIILIKAIRLGSVGISGMILALFIINIFQLIVIIVVGIILCLLACLFVMKNASFDKLISKIEAYASGVLIFSIISSIYMIMFKPGIQGTYYLLSLIIAFGCMILSTIYSIKSQNLKKEQLKIVKLINKATVTKVDVYPDNLNEISSITITGTTLEIAVNVVSDKTE